MVLPPLSTRSGFHVPGMLLLSPHLPVFLPLSIKVPKARSRLWGCSVTWKRVDAQTPSGEGRVHPKVGQNPRAPSLWEVVKVWSPDQHDAGPRAVGQGFSIVPGGRGQGVPVACWLLLPLSPAFASSRCPSRRGQVRACSPPSGHHEFSVGSGRGAAAADEGAQGYPRLHLSFTSLFTFSLTTDFCYS